MKIQEILEQIELDHRCNLIKKVSDMTGGLNLPKDLEYFYNNYESLELFPDESFGIRIVSPKNFIPTSQRLYPEGDVIWEELEDDISNHWYLIAEAEEQSQYISIDLGEFHNGYCYDSFLDIHATPGESNIIAKNFAELLERLYKSEGKSWYWVEPSFVSYGDAYEEHD
ncbi:SMI1/KNR4 family protein [Flavobacterium sp. LS1R47]|uniref:SMI1/KNR4 family protein n=1 Tax=Flavobacterium frigoritolerans TaxID=2987686 RepID=A0A9X3C935_9FLAO|nr:SMI1/KNR4 family protein [Flavobacterium frigoritolerans]MCV9933858.1 SMI1/KNR4 family protein [Flavobacterium frigoritolerans]